MLERVFYHLNLEEREYFGLKYLDVNSVCQWLDPLKEVKKQSKDKGSGVHQFHFRVKFYSSDPCQLREEITRYQFFLQLKSDLQTGTMHSSLYQDNVELSALVLQSECGDFNPEVHNADFVSEFRFSPSQTEVMEMDILRNFMTLIGTTPAEAEFQYLGKARNLELYGVDMHTVMVSETSVFIQVRTLGGKCITHDVTCFYTQ